MTDPGDREQGMKVRREVLGDAEIVIPVRGALRNALTPEEIKEVILHTAVYAGVPGANDAFRIAQRVLDEEG